MGGRFPVTGLAFLTLDSGSPLRTLSGQCSLRLGGCLSLRRKRKSPYAIRGSIFPQTDEEIQTKKVQISIPNFTFEQFMKACKAGIFLENKQLKLNIIQLKYISIDL